MRLVVPGGGNLAAQAEAALRRLEQLSHGGAVGGNLHLHAAVAIEVDDGEGPAGFVDGVLRDVKGALVAFGAEGAAAAVGFTRVRAGRAAGGVSGEGFHDVELVVVGEARVGGGDWGEDHLPGGVGHCGGFGVGLYGCGFGGWWWGWDVVVGCFGVLGRQLDHLRSRR